MQFSYNIRINKLFLYNLILMTQLKWKLQIHLFDIIPMYKINGTTYSIFKNIPNLILFYRWIFYPYYNSDNYRDASINDKERFKLWRHAWFLLHDVCHGPGLFFWHFQHFCVMGTNGERHLGVYTWRENRGNIFASKRRDLA